MTTTAGVNPVDLTGRRPTVRAGCLRRDADGGEENLVSAELEGKTRCNR